MSIFKLDEKDQISKLTKGITMTFNVIKYSFNDNMQNYRIVVENMNKAAIEWERICGIKFQHLPQLDNEPLTNDFNGPSKGVLFSVRSTVVDNGMNYASSFFPETDNNLRLLIIYPLYFNSQYDQVGLLRHELGHILGLRHECEHKDSPCHSPAEGKITAVTEYDPFSVMHSPTDNLSLFEMRITELDKQGTQIVYGGGNN